MLINHVSHPEIPPRVVIIGKNSFVGRNLQCLLEESGISTLGLGRDDVDLQQHNAGEDLAKMLMPDDTVVAVSAIAPVKNLEMLQENLKIIATLKTAIEAAQPHHVINISSDAVYTDIDQPMTETTETAPTSLHGIMHLTRELVLSEASAKGLYTVVRPTLIYGSDDPHNGYGPNRFYRQAQNGEDIVLFGEGEERRDHIWVKDVAQLVRLIIQHKSTGVINAASGELISFFECANHIATLFGQQGSVKTTQRNGPMPHNGYRAFDPSALRHAFPEFTLTDPRAGFSHLGTRVDV